MQHVVSRRYAASHRRCSALTRHGRRVTIHVKALQLVGSREVAVIGSWWGHVRRTLARAARRRMLLAGVVIGILAILLCSIIYTTWQPKSSATTDGGPPTLGRCSSLPNAAQPCTYRYFVVDMRLIGTRHNFPCPVHPGDSMLVVWAAQRERQAVPDPTPRPVELQLLLFGPFASVEAENQFNYALGKSWTFPAGWPRTGWEVQHAWPQLPVAASPSLDTDTHTNLIVISQLTVPPELPPGVYWLIDREDELHAGGQGGGIRCPVEAPGA